MKDIRYPKIKLLLDEYYDFKLTNEELYSQTDIKNKLISFIDINDDRCVDNDDIQSTIDYVWGKAINEGLLLKYIGLTSTDNGYITFDKNTILYEDFIKLLQESKLVYEGNDFKLHLNKVNGNTELYEYESNIILGVENYVELKGGFYQGFFKSFEEKYQILPDFIDSNWLLNFKLRPMVYETSDNILNNRHPNNKGIFFYIGSRAENKFWELYKETSGAPERITNTPIDDTYYNKDEKIDVGEGYEVNKTNYYSVLTNNKHLLFHRSEGGFLSSTWKRENDDLMYKFIHRKNSFDGNYFLLMNRTDKGYTASTINKLLEEQYSNEYNIINDITNNALALRITDEGSIGYRYLISDCDNEFKFSIVEEYSKQGLINNGEWNNISVRFIVVPPANCKNETGKRKMKIMFYVNGFLIFISKELPELQLRELKDIKEKQEGVAYNISLGGGTQGLSEKIWLNYKDNPQWLLPLEKYFAGTFIGDIQKFGFYDDFMSYEDVNSIK